MRVDRTIGRLRGVAPGPMLIVVGGVHGNEPAGVRAAEGALARLAGVALRGDVVALAGNLRALHLGRRYQVRDLNRQWAAPPLRLTAGDDAEGLEQRELGGALDEALAAARGPAYFIDLHTTSAAGVPFAMLGDTLRNRAFARRLPLPVILGLEEQLDGTLAEHMSARGCVALACEGGQHQDPESARNMVALLLVALAAAGLAKPAAVPGWAEAWTRLKRGRGSLPRIIEVRFRHGVAAGDRFVMEPGFANVARVRLGQLLARDRHGDIRAPSDGLVLLPLYQAQGEDGFFFGREVGALAHDAAVVARRLHLDALLPLLPGVRRAGAGLGLAPDVAERYPMGLFRMFGYRRIVAEGDGSLILRRRAPG